MKVYAEHWFKSRGLTAEIVNKLWTQLPKRRDDNNKCYVPAVWIDGKLGFTDVMIRLITDGKGREYLSVHSYVCGGYGGRRTYLLK